MRYNITKTHLKHTSFDGPMSVDKTTAKYQYTATRNIIPSSTAFTQCEYRYLYINTL
jgi:hypothetical protein